MEKITHNLTFVLKGPTLATNMEKSESLLDQIIRRREQRVELVKTATERALAEEGENRLQWKEITKNL